MGVLGRQEPPSARSCGKHQRLWVPPPHGRCPPGPGLKWGSPPCMLFCEWGVRGPQMERTCQGHTETNGQVLGLLCLNPGQNCRLGTRSARPSGEAQRPSVPAAAVSPQPTAQEGPGLGGCCSRGLQAQRGAQSSWRSLETGFWSCQGHSLTPEDLPPLDLRTEISNLPGPLPGSEVASKGTSGRNWVGGGGR